jgi:hypothetical protein
MRYHETPFSFPVVRLWRMKFCRNVAVYSPLGESHSYNAVSQDLAAKRSPFGRSSIPHG